MSEEYSAEQVDQMYSEAMNDSYSTSEDIEPQALSTEEQEMLFDIKWNGETKQLPKDKVVSYAQQGYDYSQKMQKFNLERRELEQKRAAWESEQRDLQSKYDNLSKIDEYARQNPQWLQTIQQQFEQQQQQQGGSGSLLGGGGEGIESNPLLSQFQEKLSSIEQQLQERAKIEEQQRIAQEDAALDNEIMSYKDKYGNFSWDRSDDITGLNLEQQILQHAQDNGIQNFRAAANDYLHDKLIAMAEERAKQSLVSGIQKDNKLGLGSPTRTSSLLGMPSSGGGNISSKSYEALVQEALDGLNN